MPINLTIDSQICGICLQEAPTSQLDCSHCYHLQCIGEWFKKRANCPCCRKEGIEEVKIYCEVCREKAYTCSSRLLYSQSELHFKCEQCQEGRKETPTEEKAKDHQKYS
jgi:hypothetical protein